MITYIFDDNKTFSLDLVTCDTILKKILFPDTKKATHSNDVPTKIV